MKKYVLIFISGCIAASFYYADTLRVIANSDARPYACMIADSINNQIVMFGGGLDYQETNAVWSLNMTTEEWKPLYPSGAVVYCRAQASAVYYPDSNAMILIGGRDFQLYFDQVFLLKLLPGAETWRHITISGSNPTPRRAFASCVWDRLNNRLIYFGGEYNSAYLNNIWSLNLNDWSWSLITPTGAPPSGRCGHSAIYDQADQRMIVFGGCNSGIYNNEVWALNLYPDSASWFLLSPSGSPPGPRGWHFSTYDPLRNGMVVGFGSGPDTLYNDAWILTLNPLQWTCILIEGPKPRQGSCSAYNYLNHEIIINSGGHYQDTYSLKPNLIRIDK